MKRFIAMLCASILAVGLIAYATAGTGRRTDGLYYEASGIRPDAKLITVNGETVPAEEYLYWLAYQCEYLSSYVGSLDFSAQLTDGMTFGEYAKKDALETVKLYAVVRQWADKNGITLTESDQAEMDQQRQQYVSYYGSEEAYLQQIQLLGISEDAFEQINSTYYLYQGVARAYCTKDGALRPTDDALISYAAENGYYTAKYLYVSTQGQDETSVAQQRAQMESCAAQLREAENMDAKYLELAKSLGMTTDGSAATFQVTDVGTGAGEILEALESGQVSDVVEGESGLYVFIRQELDLDAIAQKSFNSALEEARDAAKVKCSKAYDKLDAGNFYTALQQARSSFQSSSAAAGQNNAG